MTTNQTLNQLSAVVSVRNKTVNEVNQAAKLWQEPRYEVYGRIYERLKFLYGVDLTAYPRYKGESLLRVAERNGLIDKVYALACAENLYYHSYEE